MPPTLIGGKFMTLIVYNTIQNYGTPVFATGWNYLMCDLNLLDNDEQLVGSSVDRFGLDRCLPRLLLGCSHGRLRYLPTE